MHQHVKHAVLSAYSNMQTLKQKEKAFVYTRKYYISKQCVYYSNIAGTLFGFGKTSFKWKVKQCVYNVYAVYSCVCVYQSTFNIIIAFKNYSFTFMKLVPMNIIDISKMEYTAYISCILYENIFLLHIHTNLYDMRTLLSI